MSTTKRIKVGAVAINTSPSDHTASINLPSSSAVELSCVDTLSLMVANEILAQSVIDAMLSSKGEALQRKIREDNQHLSNEQLRDLLFETLPSGETATDGTRSSEWMITFLRENVSRVELVIRYLCELHVRKASAHDFFLAYVYSNTDNIQGTLHFLDYTRAHSEPAIEQESEALQEIGATLVTQLHDSVRMHKGSESEKQLWSIFAQGAPRWSEEDIAALTHLSKIVTTREHFFALVSLAGSLRPSALFHFESYLARCEEEGWHHILTCKRQYAAESLATRYRIVDICFAVLCQEHGVPHEQPQFRLSLDEIRDSAPHIPMHPNGKMAREILCFLNAEKLSPRDVEDIQKSLAYLVTKKEIENQTQGSGR